MRALFIIVGVFGLFLTGLSVFEMRVVLEHRAKIHDVQTQLDDRQQFLIAEEMRKHIHYSYEVPLAGYELEDSLKTLDELERAWLTVASIGGVLLVLSIVGLNMVRRKVS